jgi:hypothetical protein
MSSNNDIRGSESQSSILSPWNNDLNNIDWLEGRDAAPGYTRRDRGAIGQRHHRADPGDRHQAPTHLIVPNDDQQAAVQDAKLLTKHPPDNEQRLDQNSQVGQVINQFLDPRLVRLRSLVAMSANDP